MTIRTLGAISLAVGIVIVSASSVYADSSIFGHAKDSQIQVEGSTNTVGNNPTVSAGSNPDVGYLKSGICPTPGPDAVYTPACPADVMALQAVPCPSGATRLPQYWMRTRDPNAVIGWTPFKLIPGSCPEDPGFPGLTAVDFQRLPLTPSELHVEPPTGWTLANVDTIVYASGASQTLHTTVLGFGVTVRARPTTFTWTFGDGSAPFATTDPGKAYPHASITHVYGAEATVRIKLATQWAGEFLVDGSATWLPVDGTAQTATTSEPLTVYTAHSRLVADPT